MNTEANFKNRQEAIDQALENIEANNRLLRLVQILHKINQREKVINCTSDDKRNTNHTGKAE